MCIDSGRWATVEKKLQFMCIDSGGWATVEKKLQFMCIDSGGWATVEKAPYFVILATATACIKLDLCPSIFAVLCLPPDIFLLACFEFDNRL
jgi:hypothetical protein